MSARGKHGNHTRGPAHHNWEHGESKKTAEHGIWMEMLKRCYCVTNRAYAKYGARGITVCAKWAESYAAFLEDMGRRPSPKHSIDRIDNNGNYEPGNCRWATKTEQVNNRSNTCRIPFLGALTPIADVCRSTGIERVKLWKRIFVRGWEVERAIQP